MRRLTPAVIAAAVVVAATATADGASSSGGKLTRTSGNQLSFELRFNRAVSGFEISVGRGRQVTSFSALKFGCRSNPLVNGRVVCRMDRTVKAGRVIRGLLKTSPAPRRGMGGRFYGRNGNTRFGPITLKGP